MHHTVKTVFIVIILVFLPFEHVQAARIMVKPMRVNASVHPGARIRVPIEIRNNSSEAEGRITVDVIFSELVQKEDGYLDAVPGAADPKEIPDRSARKWLTAKAREITIPPLKIGTVELEGQVPYQASGFYFAAVVVQERRQEEQTVNIAFMVPIILEIEGRPVRQNIVLEDTGMEFIQSKPDKPATTEASMKIANQGLTFSRIRGRVQIFAQRQNRLILVSNANIRELSIMPGVTLDLTADLKRRLPSGRYELIGELFVDGRRRKPLKKEIDFTGDPKVDILAVDTSLILEPPELFITSLPGAMRSSVIALQNASSDMVVVETGSAIPENLRGVAIGQITGDQLTCADWIRISPSTFRIKGGAKQNVRVVTKIPKDKNKFPNYYGLLKLTAKYPDGQSAGETESLVCLSNKTARTVYQVKITKFSLAQAEKNIYLVKARLANTGNIHFQPACNTVLETLQGIKTGSAELNGEAGLMLPMAVRDFSGEIDFSKIEPGDYRLVTTVQMTKDLFIQDTTGIKVKEEQGGKIVTTIKIENKKTDKNS